MNILFLITARGGSKGVPKKNIQEIAGLPLVAYKAISAKKCKYKGRLIVSTDSKEIAQVCEKYDVEVPFFRPDYLASDVANSIDVVIHAMNWIEEHDNQKFDYVFLLEPSSPFATSKDFDEALDLIINSNADTLLSVKEVEVSRCFINTLDNAGGLSYFYESVSKLKKFRRQDQNKEYTMNGCIYIAQWDYIKNNRSFHSIKSIPYIMDGFHSIEIDSLMDLEYAKFCVEKGLVDVKKWKYNYGTVD